MIAYCILPCLPIACCLLLTKPTSNKENNKILPIGYCLLHIQNPPDSAPKPKPAPKPEKKAAGKKCGVFFKIGSRQ